MFQFNRKCRWPLILALCVPLISVAGTPVKSMVIFGDSLSDIGNTTHLLKSLRLEDSPTYLVSPLKTFVLNKMVDFANDYYVPQVVLDTGLSVVTQFFDRELAPYLANLIAKVRLVPLLPGEPYWNSRFSNGKVWNEYLANMLGISMSSQKTYINRAFGGSWAATYDYQLTVWNLIRHPIATIKSLVVGKLIPPSLGLTVQAYLLEHQNLNPDTVYFIFAGGNDYLNFLQFEDNYNPAIMTNYITNVVDSIDSSVLKLAHAGARRFVIMGIPHVGDSPKFANISDKEIVNQASDKHNVLLEARIKELQKVYPDADFLYIDMEAYLAKALADPVAFGFTNVNDACIDVKFPMFAGLANSPFANNTVLRYAQVLQYKDKNFAYGETNYNMCSTPDSYLFWDEVHPGTRAHSYMALETCTVMKAHGYEIECKLP